MTETLAEWLQRNKTPEPVRIVLPTTIEDFGQWLETRGELKDGCVMSEGNGDYNLQPMRSLTDSNGVTVFYVNCEHDDLTKKAVELFVVSAKTDMELTAVCNVKQIADFYHALLEKFAQRWPDAFVESLRHAPTAPTSGAGKTGIEFTLPSARAADILREAALRAHVAIRTVSENEMRLETFGIPARCLLEAGERGKTRVLIDDIFLQTGMGYDTWKFFVMMCKELGTSAAPITPTLPTINAGDGQGEKESAKGIATVQHLAWLRQNIAEYFNLDELRTLCFDMGIQYENLAASTLDGMARELVAHCERAGKIRELVAKLRKLRSNVSWEDVPE